MPSPLDSAASGTAQFAGHVLWVAEAALGRLRKTIPSGGLVDDGDGFVFLIEDPRELEQVVAELTAGSAYGVARTPGNRAQDLVQAIADARHEGRQKLRGGPDRTPRMAAIATPAVVIPPTTTGEEARLKFLEDETLTTLVYADERRRPVAALGREGLFRMFSGRYGHAVFAGRPVIEAADPHPRMIDADATIVEAATTVANRDGGSLFDDVLVVDPGGRLVGLVRVRDLLRALTSMGLDRVQHLNPLTGLPGGARTEQALAEILDNPEPLVVSRIDVVDFKSFNEQTGFTTGDRTIQSLGHAVASCARGRGVRFVGHLGGDDFIIVWNDEDEAVVGAIEIAQGLLANVENLRLLPAGVAAPDLAVSTLVIRPGQVRDVGVLANSLSKLKEEVRRHGGAVHALARLETVATPAWRPLDAGYIAMAGQVAGLLER